MTFCVGIKLEHGLVALADTQIVKGASGSARVNLRWCNIARSNFLL